MKAVLTTTLPVRRVAVFAEMAWMQRRPELGMLCREALAQGGRLGPETALRVLPGLSEAGARNLLASCRMLDLCTADGALTALGHETAARDEAPVREQGSYDLWCVEHPLFGSRVLGARRLSSDSSPHITDARPFTLSQVTGRVFTSVTDASERFIVRSLPRGREHPLSFERPSAARCTLRWTLDFAQGRDRWQLDGSIEDPSARDERTLRPMRHAPESSGVDLPRVLTEWATGPLSSLGRWNPSTGRLAMALDALSPNECDTFQVKRPLGRVTVLDRGTFETADIQEFPIEPGSASDAQRWASGRLARWFDANPGFWTRSAVLDAYRGLVADTPLARFPVAAPAHDELLTAAARAPTRFWSLAAPVDLAATPVSASRLASVSLHAL